MVTLASRPSPRRSNTGCGSVRSTTCRSPCSPAAGRRGGQVDEQGGLGCAGWCSVQQQQKRLKACPQQRPLRPKLNTHRPGWAPSPPPRARGWCGGQQPTPPCLPRHQTHEHTRVQADPGEAGGHAPSRMGSPSSKKVMVWRSGMPGSTDTVSASGWRSNRTLGQSSQTWRGVKVGHNKFGLAGGARGSKAARGMAQVGRAPPGRSRAHAAAASQGRPTAAPARLITPAPTTWCTAGACACRPAASRHTPAPPHCTPPPPTCVVYCWYMPGPIWCVATFCRQLHLRVPGAGRATFLSRTTCEGWVAERRLQWPLSARALLAQGGPRHVLVAHRLRGP